MALKINFKISSKTSGIVLEDLRHDQAVTLTETLMGVKGVTRCTIEWEGEEDESELGPMQWSEQEPKPPEQEPEPEPPKKEPKPVTTQKTIIREPPGESHTVAPESPEQEPEPPEQKPERKRPRVIFKEMERVAHRNLGKYVDIDNKMGYHDQEDGGIVICYYTTKVYTSWEDMFELPVYIDADSIITLNNLKQVAVRQFRKWMSNHLDQLPEGVDPDAEFRSLQTSAAVYPPLKPKGQDFGREDESGGF